MALDAALKSAYAKPVLHALCLLPLAALVYAATAGGLGANPVETLTHETGEWTLRLLLLTLAVSPLRQWSGTGAWLRFRRMLGLYTYFYACCHFSVWFLFDHSLDPASMLEDIVKRPYISVGFSAFMIMLPLALTSNQAMVRRLGKKWKSLHQLVYLAILLGILHFMWLVKADYLEPSVYAIIAVILLIHRVGPCKRFSIKSLPVARKPG